MQFDRPYVIRMGHGAKVMIVFKGRLGQFDRGRQFAVTGSIKNLNCGRKEGFVGDNNIDIRHFPGCRFRPYAIKQKGRPFEGDPRNTGPGENGIDRFELHQEIGCPPDVVFVRQSRGHKITLDASPPRDQVVRHRRGDIGDDVGLDKQRPDERQDTFSLC